MLRSTAAQELTAQSLGLMRKSALLKRVEAARAAIIEETKALDRDRTKKVRRGSRLARQCVNVAQVTDTVTEYFSAHPNERVYVGHFDVGSNKVRRGRALT